MSRRINRNKDRRAFLPVKTNPESWQHRRLEYLLDCGRYDQAVKEDLIGRAEAKAAKAVREANV